jgi:protoporphyrinogen oxidase
MEEVIILGAGISGLGCALSLPNSRVFEATNHSGGHIYSHQVESFSFDEGAHILHTKDPEILKMINGSGNEIVFIEQSNVANFWHGFWSTYPIQNHLYELPLENRLAALTDLVLSHIKGQKRKPRNYLEWCRYQYGKYLTENFYAEYTAKYWRVPMENMATDWFEGRLITSQITQIIAGALASEDERQTVFSQYRYPARGGFYAFFRPFYDEINVTYNERAVEICPKEKIVIFESGRREDYNSLVSSVPLPDLVRMVKDVPPSIMEASALLYHTQLLCVNMVVKRPQVTKKHWFYIYDSDIEATRVSVPSNFTRPLQNKEVTTLQAEIFRRGDENFEGDAIIERTVRDMGNLLKFDPASEIITVKPILVPYAYVIPDRDRAAVVKGIIEWFEDRDIYCTGLFGRWKYIWSDEAFYSGVQTAKVIKSIR